MIPLFIYNQRFNKTVKTVILNWQNPCHKAQSGKIAGYRDDRFAWLFKNEACAEKWHSCMPATTAMWSHPANHNWMAVKGRGADGEVRWSSGYAGMVRFATNPVED